MFKEEFGNLQRIVAPDGVSEGRLAVGVLGVDRDVLALQEELNDFNAAPLFAGLKGLNYPKTIIKGRNI